MGRPSKTTTAKRNRERELQMKRQEKEERRAKRKTEKSDDHTPTLEGEDPDLAGLRSGPQPPLF